MKLFLQTLKNIQKVCYFNENAVLADEDHPKTTEATTGGVLEKRCSQKFRKIHRKTPVVESLF